VRDEKLETAFPNAPKITSGKVLAHQKNDAFVVAWRFASRHANARRGSARRILSGIPTEQ
jgi:hypothetical protein